MICLNLKRASATTSLAVDVLWCNLVSKQAAADSLASSASDFSSPQIVRANWVSSILTSAINPPFWTKPQH